MKRPLLPVALLWVGGILCAEYLRPPALTLLMAAVAVALPALFMAAARKWLLWPLIFLVAWYDAVGSSAILWPDDIRNLLPPAGAVAGVRGTLRDPPVEHIFARAYSSTVIEVSEISLDGDWQPVTGKVRAEVPALLPQDFFQGQRVEVWGALQKLPGPQADGLFNPREFYRREGIYYELKTGSLNDWHFGDPARSPPLSERFRRWATRILGLGLPRNDEASQLMLTLLLDWKTPLTIEIEDLFLRAGTFHIFAVDGLRIGLLAAIGIGLLRLARISRAACGWIMVPALWFYAGMTGWPTSAVRSAIMATAVIAGWAVRRPGDLLNSLFAAALVILAWEPGQLFQPGFQLSFIVVFYIALIVPPVQRRFKLWLYQGDSFLPRHLQPRLPGWLYHAAIYLTDIVALSFAAWVASIPLTAWYFHLFTPVGLVANCAVVPATALALASEMASLLTGGWLPTATVLFNNAAWGLLHFIIWCSRVAAHWPGSNWNVAAPSFAFCLFYYLTLLYVLTGWFFRSRWKWVIGVTLACLGMFCAVQHVIAHRTARICLLPLNGAAVVVSTAPGWGTMLVDCGNERSASGVVKPFLEAQGINRINALALAVGRVEECGGAQAILTNFDVSTVYADKTSSRSFIFHRVVDSVRPTGRLRPVQDGDEAGGWTVLYPGAGDRLSQADDNSLVLRCEVYGHSILLLPALGRDGQEALMRRHGDLRAEIVVAGLPARDEPLSDPLLDELQPKVVAIVDSPFVANRRASQKLRDRLARHSAKVLYCRDTGALTLEIAPNGKIRIHNWEFDF